MFKRLIWWWKKCVPVRSVSTKFHLVNIITEKLHVTTTTVKLLLVLDRELEHKGLVLVAELGELSWNGVESVVLASLNTCERERERERESDHCNMNKTRTNESLSPLSLASPDQLPAVWLHSPAVLSSFFQSDFTHLFSHPSSPNIYNKGEDKLHVNQDNHLIETNRRSDRKKILREGNVFSYHRISPRR